MPSSSDTTSPKGLFGLFKGESGSGKSTAALSFPGVYVLDFDKKMPNIGKKHFPDKEFHWDTFDSAMQVGSKVKELWEYCPYETLIADSFTNLCKLAISTIADVKGEDAVTQISKLKKQGIEMMSIDYWNGETRFADYFVRAMKSLWAREGNPKHIILTAHVVTVDYDPDLKTKIVRRTRSIVSGGKKVGAWLPSEFDDMWAFGVEGPELGSNDKTLHRYCITEAFGEDSAKTSYHLPREIEFTNGSLYDEVRKYVNFS